MNFANLFTGIGVWDLAAQELGYNLIFQCEYDKKKSEFLKTKFPNVPNLGDICNTNFSNYKNKIDVLTISDPCTTITHAGKRNYESSPNYLWRQAFRAISEIKPTVILCENAANRANTDFDSIHASLANEGYTVEPPFIIPALSVDARHERYRLFFVAYSNESRRAFELCNYQAPQSITQLDKAMDIQSNSFLQFEQMYNEPAVFRMADGITKELHIPWRVSAIGDALHYRIAYILLKTAKELLFNYKK